LTSQLAHEDIGTDLSMWKLFDEDGDDCWSNAEFDKMCVPPCDLTFIDVSKAAAKDSKCGNDKISPDDFAEKGEDLQAFYKVLETPMTQMAGGCVVVRVCMYISYVCMSRIYIYRLSIYVCTYMCM
jgi:hypothetical protein